MKTKTRDYIILLIMLVVVAVIATRADASGDRITQSNDNNSQTTGDVSTGSGRSIAIGNVLGDVDIAQCLGSTQWNTPIFGKQKLVLNQVCMAEFYLKASKYALAAMALCNVPEILDEFSDEDACELAHDFTPIVPDHDVHIRSEEFEEAYILSQEQEEEIDYLQEEQASLVGRIEQLTAYIERVPAQKQVASEKYTDAQFEAVWAVLKGDEDE